jgi:arylsulfatase A-like enzyme/Flp pilus assembly protein TadD
MPSQKAEKHKSHLFYFHLFLLFFSLHFFCGVSLFCRADSKDEPLNLLLITVDTLRADRLSCYGSQEVKTPNMDSLAQKGVLFIRAFANSVMTLPSHTNILLGATPSFHGVHDNSNFIVRDKFLTLAEHLKKYGYATAAIIGAFPLDSRFGLTQGFDLYDDNYGSQGPEEFTYVERKAAVVIDKALGWLQDKKSPWFLWIHCFDPHQPYDPPEPFKAEFKGRPYEGEVAYVDFALGKLFAFLKEKNLEAKTLIILTADHGESLGEHGEMTHGYFAYNATLWVPLIISSPGMKSAQVTQNVSHIDIFPTVCEILGIEKPDSLQGSSLVPLMQGRPLSDRDVYFESLTAYYNRGWAPLRGFIEGNKKFIDSPLPELYDLEKDFHELNNLAQSTDLNKYKVNYEKMVKRQSSPQESEARQKADKETQEKLRSLGYISSPQPVLKKDFTAKDDLKVLLPYHNKWMKAMVSHQSGKIDEGIALLKEIISERKDFDLAYTYLANYYKEQGKLREAVGTLQAAYQNNPLSFRIITIYGIFLVDQGRYDEAIEILKKGLMLIDYDPEVWNYLGVAYWNKGSYDEALKAYEKALALDWNYPIVFNNVGSLYLSIFLKNRQQDAFEKAVENFKKAIELDPGYASAYNGLGAALKMAGNIDGAIECWKKAVELKPDFGFPLYNLGLVYLARGEKREALSYFNKYKEKFYSSLPQKEKEKLDDLIQKCLH